MRVALLLMALSAAPALAQSPGDPPPTQARGMALSTAESDALLAEGRAALLRFRLDEAETLLRALQDRPDGNLAGRYHLATAALWQAIMTEGADDWRRFYDRNEALQEALEDAPESVWTRYLDGEAHLQKALALAAQGRYRRAAFATRAAFGRFEAIVEDQPSFYDAYKGMGLLHALVGSVPSKYGWIMRMLGFEGTVEQGLQELDQAATRSAFAREEAQVLFAFVDHNLNGDRDGGMDRLAALAEAHPDSPPVLYLYATMLTSERRAEEAAAVLEQAAALQRDPAVAPMPFVGYRHGVVAFRLGDYEASLQYFRDFLAASDSRVAQARAHVLSGLAHELLGRREAALPHYRAAAAADAEGTGDSQRLAAARLQAPMTEREVALLQGRNRFDAGRYAAAEEVLRPILEDPEASAAERGEAAYRLGRLHHVRGETDSALERYAQAAAAPGDPLAKWGPWSLYYAGTIHERAGDTREAGRLYRAALDWDGDFDQRSALEQQARTALDRL